MRRVRHCHKVCSLFGTVSALQLVSEVGWLKKRTWTPLGTRFLREHPRKKTLHVHACFMHDIAFHACFMHDIALHA